MNTPRLPTITLIGLGPGDPALLTRAAWELLETAPFIYTPVPDHPALADVPPGKLRRLPGDEPRAAATFLIEQAAMNGGACCALPGHPRDHHLAAAVQPPCPEAPLYTVRMVPGISLIDMFCEALAIAGRGTGLQVLDAATLLFQPAASAAQASPAWCEIQGVGVYTPPIVPYPCTPTQPALIWTSWTTDHAPLSLVQRLHEILLLRYPPAHQLRCVGLDAYGRVERVRDIALRNLPHDCELYASTAIYLPPLDSASNRRSFEGLEWVAARLLGPDGCPWDREQTHQSLRAGLLEETYEVLEALDSGDMPALAEELGDLLLQVVVHSEMARQAGSFSLQEVLEHITTKLIRRHPHVFGDLAVEGAGAVLHNWEQIKAQELAEKGRRRTSALDGIPAVLPALATAQKLVTKAARMGFDWDERAEVVAKVREELEELVQVCAHDPAPSDDTHSRRAEEFGDLLFAAANLARWLDLDAESALREANAKFCRRFAYVEQAADAQGHNLRDLPKAEMLALWQRAKEAAQREM